MSWNEYLAAQKNAQQQLAMVSKFRKQQAMLAQQLVHAKKEINDYEYQLNESRKKLNKLDKFSFINALRELTGKKDELIEESLEEAAILELKLTEAQLMWEDLQDDYVDCMQRLNAVNEPYVEEELKTIERKKELWLMQHAPIYNKEMMELVEKELNLLQLIREINEAIYAGKEAKDALQRASNLLNDAKNYSTWDTFLGGGLIATSLKHDKLKDSNSAIHNAQITIQRFQNELLDVQNMKQQTLAIDLDGFVKFADYFFDDIFSAWSIHSKIKSSQFQISKVLDDIDNTLTELEWKLTDADQIVQQIEQRKEEILSKDEHLLK